MQKQTRRHRHFLAAPLCAVALMFSSLTALRANVLPMEDVVPGTEVISKEGTATVQEDQVVLTRGTYLLSTNDFATVRAGDATIYAILGGFHVAWNDTLTVAALSAPVLVHTPEGDSLLPIGQQWKQGKGMTAIPQRFLQEQREKLPLQRRIATDLPTVSSSKPSTFDQALLFEGARQREEDEYVRGVLGYLRWLTEWDNTEEIKDLIAERNVFETPLAKRMLVALLPQAQTSAMRTLLLENLFRDDVSTLLLSVYGQTADQAVLSQHAYSTAEEEFLFLLRFPQADWNKQAFGDVSIRSWQERTVGYLAASTDPAAALSTLLSELIPTAKRFELKGYPERARRLADALGAISKPYMSILPEELATDVQSLLVSLDRVEVQAEEPQKPEESEVEADVEVVESIPADQIVAAAYAALSEAGALFTVQTEIFAVGPTEAQIQEVVFASSEGDSIVSFILDISTNTVKSIVKEGKEYPYALGFEEFLKWIKA